MTDPKMKAPKVLPHHELCKRDHADRLPDGRFNCMPHLEIPARYEQLNRDLHPKERRSFSIVDRNTGEVAVVTIEQWAWPGGGGRTSMSEAMEEDLYQNWNLWNHDEGAPKPFSGEGVIVSQLESEEGDLW